MLGPLQIITDLASTIVATCIGIIVFKRLDLFYRLLLLQTIIYLLVDSTASVIDILSAGNYNNSWIYNISLPIETALLFSAAHVYFNSKKSKQVLLILFGCFLIIYFLDVFYIIGIKEKLAYHAAITEGAFISGIYLIILYFQFREKISEGSNAAVIAACIGMVIYFACTIPFLCIVFYVEKEDQTTGQKLFQLIVVRLADFRYFFIAIAFYLKSRSNTSEPAHLKHR